MIMMLKYLVEYIKLNYYESYKQRFYQTENLTGFVLGFDVVVETKSLLAIFKFKTISF